MRRERLYSNCFKLINNFVIGKRLRRRFIDVLRKAIFTEVLADDRITAEEAMNKGTLKTTMLAGEVHLPVSSLVREAGRIPAHLRLPQTIHPPLHMYSLEGGYCYQSFVLDRNRSFISNAIHEKLFNKTLYRNNPDIRASPPVFIEGEAIALHGSYTNNYYHWFADLIGKLLLIPNWRECYLCTDTSLPYQRETLDLLGVSKDKVISLETYALYQFKTVHVVAPDLLSPHSFKALQEFTSSLHAAIRASADGECKERLYISRNDASGRRGVANEEEILPVLKNFGFKRIIMTGRPVAEQITLVRNAEYIVYPQGAACAHMLFCCPGTSFLELYSPRFIDATSVYISRAMGLKHHMVLGEKTPDSSIQASFRINPSVLKNAMAHWCGS